MRKTLALALAALALAGCSKSSSQQLGPDGGLPPDVCNSMTEAVSSSGCQLTLGQLHLDYISTAQDQDWFSVQLPANLTARSLVHVVAGYQAPNTPVDLTVNLLKQDGKTSLARGVDNHGQGAPKPVELIVPYAGSNEKLLLLVQDAANDPANPNFDVRNPYGLTVSVDTDPDANEPNDTPATATTINLSAGANGPTGTSNGYLSTAGDVDQFQFTVPTGRKIVYLHVTAPSLQSQPTNYRLAYTLYDPTGTPISEDVVQNAFLAVDLATSRLSTTGGTYRLVIQGYVPTGQTSPAAGDLRVQYTVNVELLDDLDASEPNDTMTQADSAAQSVSLGNSASAQGRLSYVPDSDWFAFDLPANANATLLHYKLTASSGSNRFTPLPGPQDREVRVFTVTDTASCKANVPDGDCPKGYEGDNTVAALVQTFCVIPNTPPLCLRSYRLETPQLTDLHNFEGMLPVAAHPGSAQRWYFEVEDQGTNWADDEPYTLTVESLADPDSTNEAGPPPATLADDSSGTSFPAPTISTTLSGVMSRGYGRLVTNDPNLGQGMRGPQDYDAVPTGLDRFELDMPSVSAPPYDRTWELQWSVDELPDGGLPYNLAIGVEFCDGDNLDAGACTPVSTDPGGDPLVLAYDPSLNLPWYSNGFTTATLYDFDSAAGSVTAAAAGCFCFEPRFVKGGKFFLTVGAADRNDYALDAFHVHTAWTSYPKSYDGGTGTKSCPAPVALSDGGYDPGCKFTGG